MVVTDANVPLDITLALTARNVKVYIFAFFTNPVIKIRNVSVTGAREAIVFNFAVDNPVLKTLS